MSKAPAQGTPVHPEDAEALVVGDTSPAGLVDVLGREGDAHDLRVR